MPRPAMRSADGRWSVSQLTVEAGLTPRVARTLVAAGLLDPAGLRETDVVVARVAAALLDAPRPPGSRAASAAAVARRNDLALQLTREVLAERPPAADATLAVSPDDAQLSRNPMALIGLVGQLADRPLLLLPVGLWARQLPSHRATGPAPR